MLNSKNERELCYLVKVDEIRELPGYDRVESARTGGWWCIVPKGQFHVGSFGVYFEIDSLVDGSNPVFSFMEKRDFKVKTQKMCKSISQGLLMHPSDFGWEQDFNYVVINKEPHYVEDDSRFLTKILNVHYYEPGDNTRKAPSADKYKKMAARHTKLAKTFLWRFLYSKEVGKKFLYALFGKKKDKNTGWPSWVVKTDEERIQNLPWILSDKSEWVVTEKIDGTSTTFTMKRGKFGKNNFFVCSRNVVFDKPNKKCYYEKNVYTEMAEKYNIEEFLTNFLKDNPEVQWVTLQGETYGSGIQKRDYGLTEHQFMGFNFITSKDGRWNSCKAAYFCNEHEIPWVPVLDDKFVLPDTMEEMLNYATGKSVIDGGMREGVVLRSQDGTKSFKAVSNEFLLKYHS